MYVYNWITLLYIWNEHIINHLYVNLFKKKNLNQHMS